MEEFRATYARDIYRSPDGTFAVAVFQGEKETRTVVGNLPEFDRDEAVVLTGEWKEGKYGKEFHASGVLPDVPISSDLKGIIQYLSRKAFGIGPATAEAVVARFGENTGSALEDSELLQEVPGIGPERARNIQEAWRKDVELRRILVFLYGLGLTQRAAGIVISEFGPDSEEYVRENPYILLEVGGVPFHVADTAARRLGIGQLDTKRLQAGLKWVLKHEISRGNCALLFPEAVRAASELLEVPGGDIVEYGIEPALGSERLEAYTSDGVGVYLQLPVLREAEQGLASRLLEMRNYARARREWIAPDVPVDTSVGTLELSEEQRAAISAALSDEGGVVLITGGPGTGKTTIIRGILNTQKRRSISMCAPTGRAAKRMMEATGGEASTIHRLLGITPNGELEHRKADPMLTGLVVVDESSMLDINLAARLVRALETDSCRIVFVGDIDQLPSVGPGNVLKDLIRSREFKTIRLNTIYRQSLRSMIVSNAHRIHKGLPPLWEPGPDQTNDMRFRLARTPEEVKKGIQKAIEELTEEGIPLEDIQVLSPMNKGDFGTTELNLFLQGIYNPHGLPVYRGIRSGDRVLHTKNNYALGVFNGDVGTIFQERGPEQESGPDVSTAVKKWEQLNREHVRKGKTAAIVVRFKDPDRERTVVYPPDCVDQLKLAYAMSVHKCVDPTTLTETRQGLLPIQAIRHTGVIGAPAGAKRYTRLVVNNEGPAIRIRTRGGYELTMTPEHGIDVWDGVAYARREAAQLKVGDTAQLGMGVRVDALEFPELPSAPVADIRARLHRIPTHMSEDLAEFLGLMVADGTLFPRGFRLVKRHEDVVDRFRELCTTLFGAETHTVNVDNAFGAEVHSTQLASWLIRIGGLEPDAKSVPECVLRSPEVCHRRFLRGLFEDGGVGLRSRDPKRVDHIELSTVYPDIARTARVMLLRAGIVCGTISTAEHLKHLYIYGAFVRRYAERIGFIAQKKQERALLPYGRCRYMIPLSKQEALELRSLHKADIGKYNCNNAVERCSISRSVLSALPTTTAVARSLHARAENHHDTIVEIQHVSAPSMCVEVPEGHQFLQNGFCGWNSQGSEYPAVVLVLHDSHTILLARSLLYTAVTRGKSRVYVIGTQTAVDKAVRNNRVQQRTTLLRERLVGGLERWW